MSEKVLNGLIAAGVFSLIVLVIAKLETSSVLFFLMVFALSSVIVLALIAYRDPEVELADPPGVQKMPVGFGRALLEQMPTALVVINAAGRITYANSAARALVPSIRARDHFANLFRAPVFVEAVNAVINGQTDAVTQFSLPGQERIFAAQIAHLPNGGDLGEEGQVIVQFEDHTKDALSEQMRRDFVANASHELRTPLASLVGYIETLQGHAKDDPEAQERFLGIMAKQAERMNRLIEDLMSLSRIEMNAHVPPEDRCDVVCVMREMVAALTPVAAKRGVELTDALPLEPLMVAGDRDQLEQVATNLVDNAIKYGGGKVEISQAAPNEKYPRMVGITVADSGEGISREHLHRLTERFYRVNVSQSRNVGGTGLGLAIVKHILNRHGGELQITSQEGVGTRFTFWVPVKNIVTKAVKESPPTELPS